MAVRRLVRGWLGRSRWAQVALSRRTKRIRFPVHRSTGNVREEVRAQGHCGNVEAASEPEATPSRAPGPRLSPDAPYSPLSPLVT